MAVLMAKLTGVSIAKPRRKTGYNMWAPAHAAILDQLLEEHAEAEDVIGRKKVGLRTKICKEQYDDLDAEEKEEWESKAREEHAKAVQRIKDTLTLPPSTLPEDRQR